MKPSLKELAAECLARAKKYHPRRGGKLAVGVSQGGDARKIANDNQINKGN